MLSWIIIERQKSLKKHESILLFMYVFKIEVNHKSFHSTILNEIKLLELHKIDIGICM